MAKSSDKKSASKIQQRVESKARRNLFSEFWNDVYGERFRVYRLNFVRGIFFGVGSAIGATVIIALIVTVLGWLVDLPAIGDMSEALRSSIEAQ